MELVLNLELSLHAPRQARDWLKAHYGESLDRELLDDLQLLTSELVTNSVQHSGRPDGDPLTVRTSVRDGVLRMDVGDQGAGVPSLAAGSINPPTGLGFVHLLSDSWSSHTTDAFHVWFEILVEQRTRLHRANARPQVA